MTLHNEQESVPFNGLFFLSATPFCGDRVQKRCGLRFILSVSFYACILLYILFVGFYSTAAPFNTAKLL